MRAGSPALNIHRGKDIREDERHTNPTVVGALRAYASLGCGTFLSLNEFVTGGAYSILFGELTIHMSLAGCSCSAGDKQYG